MASIASLGVASPAAGDIWIIGETDGAAIEWSHAYLPGSLRIDLYDGRTLVATIADNIDVQQGAYTWTAPTSIPVGISYTIVLTSNEFPTVSDESSAFTIADIASAATLEATAPASGTTWIIDLEDGAQVQWYYEYLSGTVRIELLDSKNNVLATIADQVNVAQGSYAWTVPNTVPTGSRNTVLISSNEFPSVTAESATFDIADMASMATLDIVQPDRTATWTIGQTDGAQVEWTYEYLSGHIRIDLLEQGLVIAVIADSLSVALGMHNWTVPDSIATGSQYQVYLESISYPSVSAQSAKFSIDPAP
jgi:phage baseplate assembly protein gpV